MVLVRIIWLSLFRHLHIILKKILFHRFVDSLFSIFITCTLDDTKKSLGEAIELVKNHAPPYVVELPKKFSGNHCSYSFKCLVSTLFLSLLECLFHLIIPHRVCIHVDVLGWRWLTHHPCTCSSVSHSPPVTTSIQSESRIFTIMHSCHPLLTLYAWSAIQINS